MVKDQVRGFQSDPPAGISVAAFRSKIASSGKITPAPNPFPEHKLSPDPHPDVPPPYKNLSRGTSNVSSSLEEPVISLTCIFDRSGRNFRLSGWGQASVAPCECLSWVATEATNSFGSHRSRRSQIRRSDRSRNLPKWRLHLALFLASGLSGLSRDIFLPVLPVGD